MFKKKMGDFCTYLVLEKNSGKSELFRGRKRPVGTWRVNRDKGLEWRQQYLWRRRSLGSVVLIETKDWGGGAILVAR